MSHSFVRWTWRHGVVGALLLQCATTAQAGNIVTQINSAGNLAISFAWLMGVTIFGFGLFSFYKHNENPQQYTIAGGVARLAAGLGLIAVGTTYSLMRKTMLGVADWGADREILAVDSNSSSMMDGGARAGFMTFIPAGTEQAILAFVFFVGLVAFIKGIYHIKNIPDAGSREGSVMKPMLHIIGGIVCMNIDRFTCIIANTTGFSGLAIGSCS